VADAGPQIADESFGRLKVVGVRLHHVRWPALVPEFSS
jgi:hypothetical protein